ncbi:triokinase/FMN cyclase [Nasonia vitripennis]|uniref:DhaK domain-containing protein n=1 Tax=Nasonia vitripennis TaxID=7425 RepID=A0A7M7H8B0_NASVI|nr:triokinase/FMN cyclase [Nasonia vitripennis]
MSAYDPLQTNRRLWNDPDNILNDSLAATVMMHHDLVYHDDWKAVVRRDCDKLKKKVRIISGGAVIDGPMYTGFIGRGMLTAAVLGLDGSTTSIPTTDTIVKVVEHCVKNDKEAGVLLLIHDCAEYFLNFLQAKKKAEEIGIPVQIILVRDEINSKLSPKVISSPRSPSGLLLLYKVAGAMSEEGKSLDEIYKTCYEVVKKGSTFSIGVYIVEAVDEPVQIEMARGDRMTDHDMKRFPHCDFSTKKIVENIINESIHVSDCKKFPEGSKLAVLLDYFGKFTELESNVFIKELTHQLSQYKHKVEPIFTGAFHTSLQSNGFHLSILNLSSHKDLEYYLNAPTLAYYWPKTTKLKDNVKTKRKQSKSSSKTDSSSSNSSSSSSDDDEISEKERSESPNDGFTGKNIFLKAVEYACEAVIACAKKIDMLDKPSTPEDSKRCGTRLATAAESIKTLIREKEFLEMSLPDMLFRISLVFEQDEQDPQARLYMKFFSSIYKVIDDRSDSQEDLDVKDWMYAFDKAIDSVNKVAKDTRLEDVFLVAREAFDDAYFDAGLNSIDAIGEAVLIAQKQTSHVVPNSGKIPEKYMNDKYCGFDELAGAHAVGVWMRGAYEGMKLLYRFHERSSNKRPASDNSEDDDDAGAQVSKSAKYPHDDSSSS